MKKLHLLELDVPTLYFKVHKTIGVSYYRLLFRVHHRLRIVVGHFHHCNPRQDLFNRLSSDPNGDCMQNLKP